MRHIYISRLSLILATLAVLPVTPAMATSAPVTHASGMPIEKITSAERVRIEKMLDQALNEAADDLELIEGQTGFDIRTRLVPERRTIIIDMGGRAVPSHAGGELEDQQHRLALVALDFLRGIIAVDGAEFQFSGRDIDELRPDPSPPNQSRQRQGTRVNATHPKTVPQRQAPKIALAGGAGCTLIISATIGARSAIHQAALPKTSSRRVSLATWRPCSSSSDCMACQGLLLG